MRRVRQYAAEEGVTLAETIARALRQMLARRDRPVERERVPLPTFRGCGLQPGVDLDEPDLREWFEELVRSDAAFAFADPVSSGFLRVVTHPGIFDPR